MLSGRLRQLRSDGFIESVRRGSRSLYAVTDRGRTLEPIIAAIARWWVAHSLEDGVIRGEFTETAPLSILESLPFILREERARGVHLCFEVRLTGEGGGVWTIRIDDGRCTVQAGFAEHADVRYTADARAWCAVALGRLDAREAVRRGLLTKDGGREALDHYFHQIARPETAGAGTPGPGDRQRREP